MKEVTPIKKLLALLLALSCLLSLTACGGEKLEEPPKLRIVAEDGTVTASKGTYSWMYNNGFNWTGIESDSIHPLEYEDLVETLFTDAPTIELDFAVVPDTITVRECWSDEHWGDDYDTPGEAYELTYRNTAPNITLKQGGWIYFISASWEHENYHGSSDYVFYVVTPELEAAK